MKQKYLFLLLFLGLIIIGFSFAEVASAVCPVCVVAVGAGLGFSRWLGVDDVVSSLWIGAMLVSVSWWTVAWLKKKNWSFNYDKVIIPVAYYVLTILPLYYSGIMGHLLNKIFGIDKILFGIIAGSIIFLLGVWINSFLKTKNNGKVFFPYQKVFVPVLLLIIVSLILWKTI